MPASSFGGRDVALTITCKRCKRPIVAEDEDDLMAQVEAHARDHGGAHGHHLPTRERILAHLRQEQPTVDDDGSAKT